jgi:hypothetical protein
VKKEVRQKGAWPQNIINIEDAHLREIENTPAINRPPEIFMKLPSIFYIATVALALTGCANINTQSREFVGHQAAAKTVDASQRAIFSVNKTYWRSDGKPGKSWTAFCAEPSPDALVAYATSVSVSAELAGKALDVAASQTQAAASIGLRTQTIQLLRDGMYRLCESYASGAIDDDDMAMLQRRYQNMMIGLLAIEQITGPVIARQASLSSSSAAAIGKSIAEISIALADGAAMLEKAKTDVKDAEADVKAKQALLDAANKVVKDLPADAAKDKKTEAEAAQTAATTALDKSKAALKTATTAKNAKQTYYDSIEASLKDAQRMATSASSTVSFADSAPAHVANTGAASDYQVVVKGVVDIVETVLNHAHQTEICSVIFSSATVSKAKAAVLQKAAEYCSYIAIPATQDAKGALGSVLAQARKSLESDMRATIRDKTRPD